MNLGCFQIIFIALIHLLHVNLEGPIPSGGGVVKNSIPDEKKYKKLNTIEAGIIPSAACPK